MGDNDNIISLLYKTVYDGKGAKDAKDDMDEAGKKARGLGDKLSAAFGAVKWAALGSAISKVANKITEVTKKSADYIETLNLLEVAFDGNTENIRRFANTYADVLNLDDSTLLKSAAHFKVLSQSMGIATETGEKLSKLLTKMTLDVSSLYNIDFNKAQTALQYAMEGRGTSLKQRTGVSVLETSVQTTMDVLGIDAYVEDMNDAEKAIARVISMEYQLMSSQGDLARTIEAPANQMRIMGEQINLLARNIGNVFLPIISKILPYLNALLIVLNAVISALARLVGYKEDMFDTFESSNVVDYFDDIGGAIDGVGNSAEKAAKKMQGLRGFDKLNVVRTPTESKSSAGGGGGGIGGINPSLLNAFNTMADEYKSKLDGIKTRATEIAEKILEWLGFSHEFNEETGKWEWVFKKIKPGTILGALAVGGVVVLGVAAIFKTLKKITGLFKGGSTIGKVAKEAAEAGTSFTGFFDGLGKGVEAIAILGGLALVIKSVSDMMLAFKESGLEVTDVLALMGTIVGSITVLIVALTVAANALQSPLAMAGLAILAASISAILLVVANTLPKILDALGKFIEKVAPHLNKTLEIIGRNIQNIIYAIGTVLPPILDSTANLFDKVFSGISRVIRTVGDVIIGIMNTAKSLITTVLQSILNFINNLGPAINNFVDNAIWAVTKLINFLISGIEYMVNTLVIGAVRGLIRGINKIIPGDSLDLKEPSNVSIPRFYPRLAEGGMPEVGQMFIANEKGPELVGQIGGKTFVANQNQMLDLIDKKLQNSGGIKNATFIVQVGNKEIARQVITDLQGMAKDNGKPITIGG